MLCFGTSNGVLCREWSKFNASMMRNEAFCKRTSTALPKTVFEGVKDSFLNPQK